MKRLISAVIAVGVLITVLLLPPVALQIAVFIITLVLLYELFRAFSFTDKKVLFVLGVIPSLFAILSYMVDLRTLFVIYIFIVFAALILLYGEITFRDTACVFLLSIFVTSFLWHIVLIRNIEEFGSYLIWTVFVGACANDTFAFVTGKLVGSRKLVPGISPHKTIEGAVGGVLGTVISFLAYGLVVNKFLGLEIDINRLWVLGIVSSVAAQLGDLAASVIKRECHIKDFGTLLPGHGGVMDRFDSILFTAPAIYYFITMFPIVQ